MVLKSNFILRTSDIERRRFNSLYDFHPWYRLLWKQEGTLEFTFSTTEWPPPVDIASTPSAILFALCTVHVVQIFVACCCWMYCCDRQTAVCHSTFHITTKSVRITIFFIYPCLLRLGGVPPVSPDLNKRSKRLTPALYEWNVQCSFSWPSVALWPTGDLGATEGTCLVHS
jgi:hypothetical protein